MIVGLNYLMTDYEKNFSHGFDHYNGRTHSPTSKPQVSPQKARFVIICTYVVHW